MNRLPVLLSAMAMAASGVALSAIGGCESGGLPIGEMEGGASSSSSSGGSSSGGNACCQNNFQLYTCTFADGGGGFACHNPALGCASSATCGEGCDPVVSGACATADGGGSSSGGTSGLAWYPTCGPPVVTTNCTPDAGPTDDAGAPCAASGSPCSNEGDLCGTGGRYACPVGLVCASGPQTNCPISSRRFKDGIQYLDGDGLQVLHDETLGIRLATYNYKPGVDDPAPRHLGFIIEDRPKESPAVDWSHDRVDIYGYLSMVVATVEVQEKEIAALRRDLDIAQKGVCAVPAASPGVRRPPERHVHAR